MVKICACTSNSAYNWVEIEFKDFIIRADSTAGFNYSIDLLSSKNGMPTNGFIFIPKELAGININTSCEKIIDGKFMCVPTYYKLKNNIDDKLGVIKVKFNSIEEYSDYIKKWVIFDNWRLIYEYR